MVTVIITVLASLLLPALREARERGRRAVCMSNLRQQGIGWLTYAADYDSRLPPVGWLGTYEKRCTIEMAVQAGVNVGGMGYVGVAVEGASFALNSTPTSLLKRFHRDLGYSFRAP